MYGKESVGSLVERKSITVTIVPTISRDKIDCNLDCLSCSEICYEHPHQQYNPNQIFPMGDGFGLFVYVEKFENTHFKQDNGRFSWLLIPAFRPRLGGIGRSLCWANRTQNCLLCRPVPTLFQIGMAYNKISTGICLCIVWKKLQNKLVLSLHYGTT